MSYGGDRGGYDSRRGAICPNSRMLYNKRMLFLMVTLSYLNYISNDLKTVVMVVVVAATVSVA